MKKHVLLILALLVLTNGCSQDVKNISQIEGLSLILSNSVNMIEKCDSIIDISGFLYYKELPKELMDKIELAINGLKLHNDSLPNATESTNVCDGALKALKAIKYSSQYYTENRINSINRLFINYQSRNVDLISVSSYLLDYEIKSISLTDKKQILKLLSNEFDFNRYIISKLLNSYNCEMEYNSFVSYLLEKTRSDHMKEYLYTLIDIKEKLLSCTNLEYDLNNLLKKERNIFMNNELLKKNNNNLEVINEILNLTEKKK